MGHERAHSYSGVLADRFGPAPVLVAGGMLKALLYAGGLLTRAVREMD